MNFFTGNQYFKRAVNVFKYNKKRWYVFGAFSTVYGATMYKYRSHNNEIVRMALAGSFSNMI